VLGLIDRGHEVELWCPPTAERSYLPLDGLAVEHVVPLHWKADTHGQGRPLRRASARWRDMRDNIAEMHKHCQLCARKINEEGFDVFLGHPCRFLRAAPIGCYVELPSVLYLQEPYRRLYEAQPELPWVAFPPPNRYWWSPKYLPYFICNLVEVQALRIQAREELLNVRAYEKLLANSLFSRESIIRAYGLDASVCYLGVDTKTFTDYGLARENTVIGVGYYYPVKNIDFIIKAVAGLGSSNVRLLWLGNGGTEAYIKELKGIARESHVKFEAKLGVDDAELVDSLNRARVMAYAPRLEPFGYAPLEANACGLPVVAVAEGGVRETIVHGANGLLVESNVQAMTTAIGQLLSDPDYAERLGRKGRHMVQERWSLSAAVDRLEKHLEDARAAWHTISSARA
jgi:glycosyltransferase involved in cell wall biosynthesis